MELNKRRELCDDVEGVCGRGDSIFSFLGCKHAEELKEERDNPVEVPGDAMLEEQKEATVEPEFEKLTVADFKGRWAGPCVKSELYDDYFEDWVETYEVVKYTSALSYYRSSDCSGEAIVTKKFEGEEKPGQRTIVSNISTY